MIKVTWTYMLQKVEEKTNSFHLDRFPPKTVFEWLVSIQSPAAIFFLMLREKYLIDPTDPNCTATTSKTDWNM